MKFNGCISRNGVLYQLFSGVAVQQRCLENFEHSCGIMCPHCIPGDKKLAICQDVQHSIGNFRNHLEIRDVPNVYECLRKIMYKFSSAGTLPKHIKSYVAADLPTKLNGGGNMVSKSPDVRGDFVRNAEKVVAWIGKNGVDIDGKCPVCGKEEAHDKECALRFIEELIKNNLPAVLMQLDIISIGSGPKESE